MPRKSTASVSAAPTEPNGDTTMASEAPTAAELSPNHKDQPQIDEQSKQEKEKEKDKHPKRKSEGDVIALDDLLLPRSIISRLSKGVLPPNTSLAKDAILALTKSATVFISHLASEANDVTDRKTIQSADVVRALREIEMGDVMGVGVLGRDGKRGGRVEREVERWEGDVRGKRRGYREKVRARESGGVGVGDTAVGDTTVGMVDEREEHENKRVRIDDEDEARDGSAGPITEGASRIKLNVGRRKSDEVEHGDGDGDEAGEDEEEESEEEEENEEEQQDETQGVDDSIDMEETDSRRKNGTLAPDGRIEVGGSDDESD
ncbi:hypothetical protein OHC33_006489 [Knufia fluminis]|uniref:DNA polymerase epsilon subunit D n=1 Tax=Knufia fluminis TaxID=191047 RepID=A0AAN8I6Y3_9EURO|nr:hypothetical protein OHC33_006489 [Knufia fluminis]